MHERAPILWFIPQRGDSAVLKLDPREKMSRIEARHMESIATNALFCRDRQVLGF